MGSKLPENIRKSKRIAIRLSANELERLQYAASKSKVTVSTFVREAAMREVQ